MASLVDKLLKNQLISEEQLKEAKAKHLVLKVPVHEALIELGYVKEKQLLDISVDLFKMQVYHIENGNLDPEVVKKMNYELAKRHGVFPICLEDDNLILAMSNPHDVVALDDLRYIYDVPIKPVLAPRSEINTHIEEYYQSNDKLFDAMNDVVDESAEEEAEAAVQEEDPSGIHIEMSGGQTVDIAETEENSSPTVKLINLILSDAIKVRASDIHLEPREGNVDVRYRVDGDLKNIMKVPKNVHSKMIARIKILANLDIAQDVKPQDGRINLLVQGRKVDFRISTIPTYYGEKVVARILDAAEAKTDMEKIGFNEKEANAFQKAITQPQGMVLVTGPTGSGKTSTLYAALNYVKSETTNIVTIEDPVEFVNEGINQIQVNPARGVTFASGLRSILRQDPNVILIGEIRDLETAEIALKASITGHLVLSTLHTNSTIATISRLADIGIDPYMIGSAVILIVSQRLVKVICSKCKVEYTPDADYLEEYQDLIDEYNITKFYKGDGCQQCGYSGYFGRTAVFEVLKITQELKDIIAKGSNEALIRKTAIRGGFKAIKISAIEKIAQGITTFEEVTKSVGTLTKGAETLPPVEEDDSELSHRTMEVNDDIDDELSEEIEVVKKKKVPKRTEPVAELEEIEAQEAVEEVKEVKKAKVVKKVKKIEPVEILKEDQTIEPEEAVENQEEDKEIETNETSNEVELDEEDAIDLDEEQLALEAALESKIEVSEVPIVSEDVPFVEAEKEPIVFETQEPEENIVKDIISEESAPKEEIIVEKKKKIIKPQVREKPKSSGSRILVVEDDEDVQKIIVKILEFSGYSVIKASNGKEGVVTTFKEKPDLIVIDYDMPGMNGVEAINILKSRLETAIIPIILLTSHTSLSLINSAKKAGADEHLSKPFNRDGLLSCVSKLLKQANLKTD